MSNIVYVSSLYNLIILIIELSMSEWFIIVSKSGMMNFFGKSFVRYRIQSSINPKLDSIIRFWYFSINLDHDSNYSLMWRFKNMSEFDRKIKPQKIDIDLWYAIKIHINPKTVNFLNIYDLSIHSDLKTIHQN